MKHAVVWGILALASCDRVHLDFGDDDEPASNQPATSAARTVAAFHAIDLAGAAGVDVVLGKPVSVQVTAPADRQDRVITKVENDTLVIETKRIGRGRIHVDVTAPDLTAVSLSGNGKLSVTGVANDALQVHLGGNGELVVSGTTHTLRATIGGNGELAASGLVASDAAVSIGGAGSAKVHATQSIDASISGAGSIDVEGNPPKVQKSVSGAGSIRIH